MHQINLIQSPFSDILPYYIQQPHQRINQSQSWSFASSTASWQSMKPFWFLSYCLAAREQSDNGSSRFRKMEIQRKSHLLAVNTKVNHVLDHLLHSDFDISYTPLFALLLYLHTISNSYQIYSNRCKIEKQKACPRWWACYPQNATAHHK